MNWQYWITGIIVLTALSITGFRLWNFFIKPTHNCDGCASSISGCALKDLKKEIRDKEMKHEISCRIMHDG